MEGGADAPAIFGAGAGDSLKRLPSEVYWWGLRSWGIRLYARHKGACFRSLDDFYRRVAPSLADSRGAEGIRVPPSNRHPHIPRSPDGFTVALRREGAEYLCDRIEARHPGSLLVVLVGRRAAGDLAAAHPWKLRPPGRIFLDLKEHLRDARILPPAWKERLCI